VSIDMEEADVTLLYSSLCCMLAYCITSLHLLLITLIIFIVFFLNILALHDSLNCILTEFIELSKIKH
jgi:hypothetical protein